MDSRTRAHFACAKVARSPRSRLGLTAGELNRVDLPRAVFRPGSASYELAAARALLVLTEVFLRSPKQRERFPLLRNAPAVVHAQRIGRTNVELRNYAQIDPILDAAARGRPRQFKKNALRVCE
ncbi:MAG: hypothetical protein RL385_855 [Pseudomonadota bacterium]|jgi:hypothetical protein